MKDVKLGSQSISLVALIMYQTLHAMVPMCMPFESTGLRGWSAHLRSQAKKQLAHLRQNTWQCELTKVICLPVDVQESLRVLASLHLTWKYHFFHLISLRVRRVGPNWIVLLLSLAFWCGS